MTRRRVTRAVLVPGLVAVCAVVAFAVLAPRARTQANPAAAGRPPASTADRDSAPAPDVAVRWSNPVRGEPDGVTVAGTDVATVEFDEVRLLDLTTGAAKWRVEIPGLACARAVFTANRVIVATRDKVVLLDRASGRPVGAVPFEDAAHLVLTQVDGRDVVVAANLDGAIAGIDVAGATSLWSHTYDGSVVDPPAAAGGLVVANWDLDTDTVMRVLSASTGEVVWDIPLGAASTPPAMAANRVFVAAGDVDDNAVLVAFEGTTGNPLWYGRFPAPWDQAAAPVVAGDTVYLLDRVGTVTAVDVATGQARWQTRTHTSVLYGRMVTNGRTVIFQTFDSQVVALDRGTGKVVSGTTEDAFPIDLAATDDILVVALRRGAPSRIEARPAP
jgi:outer membrane protein assembly factor BamB